MSYKFFFVIVSLFFITNMHAHDDCCPSMGRRLGRDFLTLQKNVFTAPTVEIIAMFIPFYTIGRIFDKPLHKRFYCFKHHHNKHQMPKGLYYGVEGALATSIAALMSLSFLGHDGQRKRTAQLYSVTLPCLWILKSIIKQIPFKGNLRPPNGCFRRCKYYGGFPSGHMFEMSFTAALFGTQLGPKYGIPLGILAGVIGLEFMNCNRHYLSQLIAGAGFGLIFASAGNRALDIPDRRFSYACVAERNGIGARVTYCF